MTMKMRRMRSITTFNGFVLENPIGKRLRSPRSLRVKGGLVLAGLGLFLLLVYIPFGHKLIRTMYDANLPLAHQLMPHRAETPLLDYLNAADIVVLKTGAVLLIGAGVLISGNLLGVALSALTLLAGSLLIFVILEVAPPLASALHFDVIPYFDFRLNNLPDAELGFVEKPFRHAKDHNWRGGGYSPSYGIDIPGSSRSWETNEEGFRNPPGLSTADVVVLGSSFPPYGMNPEDTYTRKLERHLDGYTVANLAKGGYGPGEALKVFRRFGLPKKPRYAILAFHTRDIDTFLRPYSAGEVPASFIFVEKAFGGFWSRWWLALNEAQGMLTSGIVSTFRGIVEPVPTDPKEIHPDVAVLGLPGNVTKKAVFQSRHTGMAPEDLVNTAPWSLFEKILREFKQVSEQNQVVPLVAYIPGASEVYARYSTSESGRNWLAVRESQIATSANDEEAARRLAERVGIELVSFLPAFEDAARHGELVYFQLDSHWNSEGSEIAARVTAKALQAKATGASPQIRNPTGSEVR
jgi:hypothetical protein